MALRTLLTCIGICLGLGMSCPTRAAAQGLDVLLDGEATAIPPARLLKPSLPSPPKQHESWDPPVAPAGGAKELESTRFLFSHGLADPRACEYREAFVGTGSCWFGWGARTAIHGWVLPSDGSETRFVIGWNGLIYPCDGVGEPADLTADVKQALEAVAKQGADGGHLGFSLALGGEPARLTPLGSAQIGALLLERMGWDALAMDLRRLKLGDDSPYALVLELVWNYLDRAICAHMSAEDALSQVSAKAAIDLLDAALADARLMDLNAADRDAEGRRTALQNWRDQAIVILGESRRRIQEARAPIKKEDIDNADVATLIKALEDVNERQSGQPGGVSLGQSPIVQALAQRGEAAVEPLLECLERDQRLTRSVSFWRDFRRSRVLLGVHEAAYCALASILETDFISIVSTGDSLSVRGENGRAAIVAAIKDNLKRFGPPGVERSYRTLADDGAGPDLWSQAVESIMRPDHVKEIRGSSYGGGWTVTSPRIGPIVLRGESLRAKQNPSVAELLIRRFNDLGSRGGDARERDAVRHGMAIALSKWDPPASAPILEKHAAELKQKLHAVLGATERTLFPGTSDPLGIETRNYVEVLAQQISTGNVSAWRDYEELVESTLPNSSLFSAYAAPLYVLGQFADERSAQECATRVFRKESPWNFLQPAARSVVHRLNEFPDLLRIAIVRHMLAQALDDKSVVGKVTISERNQLSVDIDEGHGWGTSADEKAPLGTTPLRLCDLAATGALGLDEFRAAKADFRLDLSVEDRDKAIAKLREVLTRHPDAPASLQEGDGAATRPPSR